MKAVGVIPARYGSQRLPGKPLALINGRPMIQHVYERAHRAKELDRLIIATDNIKIKETAEKFGAEAIMTSPDVPTGTDRVLEAVGHLDYEIVVNIQGDEPLLNAKGIDECVKVIRETQDVEIATLAEQITESEQFFDSSVVKVITDNNHNALYFSRSLIPYPRGYESSDGDIDIEKLLKGIIYLKHLGLYAFRKDALMKFASMAPSSLEMIEKLEQLRWLQAGGKIRVIEIEGRSVSVDTQLDLEIAERRMLEYDSIPG